MSRMKGCDEMFKNTLMPGVTVKSRAYFAGMDSINFVEQPPKQYTNPRTVPTLTKEIHNTSQQSQKGFYTWLSSPKTMHVNHKMNNIAVIAPTQHHP